MSATSIGRISVLRRRYPLIDDQGTMVPNFGGVPDASLIERCWLEPIESQSDQDGRLAVLTGYTGVAPAGTVFDAITDHIVVRGVEYELAGDAMPVTSPTGALDEVKFSLRRWRHAD